MTSRGVCPDWCQSCSDREKKCLSNDIPSGAHSSVIEVSGFPQSEKKRTTPGVRSSFSLEPTSHRQSQQSGKDIDGTDVDRSTSRSWSRGAWPVPSICASCVRARICSFRLPHQMPVLPGKEKVSVVAVYRPPNFDCSSFVSELDSILTTRNSDSYITCVVGDLNAKLSTWCNGQPSDVHGVALSSLMYDHGLVQMVEGPTRFSSSSASQLDLIFIDNSDAVSDCLVLPPIADHCPTLLQLQLNVMSLSPQHKRPCKSWNFKLADFRGLNNFLKSVDWSPVHTTPDASAALTLWENILVSSMEQFIPFRTYGAPRPHSKPWFNSFLNRLRRKRNRLFSRSKLLDRNHPLSAAYRKIRNHYVAELRSAERQYYAKQVSALQSARLVNDPHRWWKTAKAACGLNSVDSIPPLLHNDCMKVTAEEKAACLNSVFAKQCNAQSPTSRSCSLSTNTTAGNFSFSRIEYPSVTKK